MSTTYKKFVNASSYKLHLKKVKWWNPEINSEKKRINVGNRFGVGEAMKEKKKNIKLLFLDAFHFIYCAILSSLNVSLNSFIFIFLRSVQIDSSCICLWKCIHFSVIELITFSEWIKGVQRRSIYPNFKSLCCSTPVPIRKISQGFGSIISLVLFYSSFEILNRTFHYIMLQYFMLLEGI